ncbi:hypothetical protein [Morganella morganii IS15]|nr:hypothetical protein CSB69_0924 [Morganella morganii]EMP50861.1 hypothetical protein C790_01885 [Morganella morganii SC01]CDK67033.1 hypothetical protein [Morganella morganii IS15]
MCGSAAKEKAASGQPDPEELVFYTDKIITVRLKNPTV